LSKRRSRDFQAQAIENNVVSLNTYYNKKRQVHLLPKTLNQETYINLLTDPSKIIIFATGPAGTGKTMLAMLAGIKALKEGVITKLVLTRPAVGVDDEKHGFLPGDLNQKMEPWTRPLFDVLAEYYDRKDIARMLDEQIIEISPLAFMRGRNLKNAFIICDEMQNASINQMKMVLTRLASNSKMVITGDLKQTDKQFADDNGLLDFIERLKQTRSCTIAHTHFSRKDVQRHPVVAEVLSIYGEE
jgi:phosphate starvation-inducible protein PhoH and related proteins